MNFIWTNLFEVLAVGLVGWGILKFIDTSNSKKTENRNREKVKIYEKKQIDPENIRSEMISFLERIDKYNSTPDGVRGRQAYTFRYVLIPCLEYLSDKFRFDIPALEAFRSDFLEYIYCLENGATASFLEAEGPPNRREQNGREAELHRSRAKEIENAFVSKSAPKYAELLEKIRASRPGQYSGDGKMEAPDGYWYLGNDLISRNGRT